MAGEERVTKLKIDNVKKIYQTRKGEMTALNGVNLDIKENEFICVVGPSGCGKSTLLNIIAGLDTPTSGAVYIDGKKIEGTGTERGVVFQQYALFPWLTVLKNVMFGLKLQGKSDAEAKEIAMKYIKMVQLEDFVNHYPKELSGGMKQRVAIARAYAVKPEVLLMDEPFGALDAQTRTQLQTELLKTETRWKWMKSLSDTANGTITGKARIMLETYIQMQYFDRILARANIRLMTMSSGQYELVRRKENKSRVGKTGLELDVVDHYNGTVRSVKTLSGGETFQASLSLALGLSDEIQSSSGGIQLDTMFVDEGFGSLDEDALDQAIRALKDLGQGSRLVGIVSHVAELKERIDKKIIVTKKRTENGVGSTICIEG